jgi:glycosyltransferase involved in cell wall biosynthesis
VVSGVSGVSGASRSLYIVVPVFNEAPNLARLYEGLRAADREAANFDVHVVLVDDGSTDGTPELARELGAGIDLTVLTESTNRGPGHAFGTAFSHLSSLVRPDDVVVTMEGDNTSRTELIAAMLRRSEEGHDAVFASPYMYGGAILHTRATRVVLSHIANTFVKEFFGVHGLLTVSSFFRLYRGSSLQRLQSHYGERIIERAGFESMVEVVMKMMYLGMSISEMPMVLDTSRRAGVSKLNTRRTILGYLALYGRKREWQERATR